MRKPLTKRLVPMGSPLRALNSEIFVVMWVIALMANTPMIRQMMLEINARINQSSKEVMKSVGTANYFTLPTISDANAYKFISLELAAIKFNISKQAI